MKEDKDLLEEFLQSKFKDDAIQPSTNRFDIIYDAVQEQKVKRNYLPWYQLGIIIILICAILGLYYIMNAPSVKKDVIPVTKKENTNNYNLKKELQTFKEEKNLKVADTISAPIINPKTTKSTITEDSVNDSVLSETEDKHSEKGKIGISYIASEKYASTKYTKYLKLPDSTTIVLRKNSRVNYNASAQGYRKIDLTGTTFFKIKKNELKPFIIHGKYGKVQVYSSSFAMSSEKKADYMTLIEEGNAEITHYRTGKTQNISLGQSFIIDNQGIRLLKNSPNQFAWKTGNLTYQNATVNDIINDLGESFDAKIQLKHRVFLDCKYTGSFNLTSTEKVLKALATKLNVKIEKKEGIFVIVGKGNCKD